MHALHRSLICLLLAGVLFILPVRTRAQLLEQDTTDWSATLAGSFFLSTGNVDRLLLRADAAVKHLGRGWGFSAEQTYQYGTFGAFQTENDLFSRNFLYYQPRRKLYPYAMVWLESNFRKRIDFRYQVGPGITWKVLDTQHSLIKLSLTGTYERTDFAGNDFVHADPQSSQVIETLRLTGRLYGAHKLFHDRLSLLYEGWFQQSDRFRSNYRFHTNVVMQVPISRTLALQSRLNYLYEHVVLRGVSPGDLYLTAGIQATFNHNKQ